VADALAAIATNANAPGQTYELGGPTVYTYQQLMNLVTETTDRKRFLAPVPVAFGKFAAWFLQLLPSPLLTVDQVKLLAADNVVAQDALGLEDLGIVAASAEAILPTYLWRFRSTGQFTAPDRQADGHEV